jgi:hypothetical protein
MDEEKKLEGPPSGEPGVKEAMADILKGIKLPERRTEDKDATPKKVYDTGLADKVDTVSSKLEDPVLQNGAGLEHSVSAVHTLQNDVERLVHDSKMSLIHAAALEEDRETKPEPLNPEVKPRLAAKTLLVSALALLVVGLGGALWSSIVKKAGTVPFKENPSIVFAEQTLPVVLPKESAQDRKRFLAQYRLGIERAALGTITHIVPLFSEEGADTPLIVPTFFTALAMKAPDELVRALGNEFFLGFHSIDQTVPVLIIRVASFERAFAGMLAWEERMNTDLAPIFVSLPETTIGVNNLPEKRRFEDLVVRNYDVRVLRDDQGEVTLYYSFPTPNLLVVGESLTSFPELLGRLRATRAL